MDEEVTKALEGLRGYHDLHQKVAEFASGSESGALYMMDFLAIAALNRSLALIRGFCDLIEAQNFLAAAPLVRLQLDSSLRFFAALSAPDPNYIADKVFRGDHLNKLKDPEGNTLTDGYLKGQLAERYPWIADVYKHTSGFVHPSEKHIF